MNHNIFRISIFGGDAFDANDIPFDVHPRRIDATTIEDVSGLPAIEILKTTFMAYGGLFVIYVLAFLFLQNR